jgi:hypothetical protein
MKKKFIYPFLVLLSSCTFQKSYIVDSPNICNFQYEKEKNIKISTNNISLNAQGNYAFGKNFGAGLNFYTGGENLNYLTSYFGGDVNFEYFKHVNKLIYLELQTGYGICDNKLTSGQLDAGRVMEYGKNYTFKNNTTYQKIFLQPDITFKLKHISISNAVKISGVYFNNYNYTYEMDDNSDGDMHTINYYGHINFKNKYGLILQDVEEFKFNNCFFIQFVTSYSPNNIENGIAYGDHDSGYIKFKNPSVWVFKVFVGVDFKLGKNKNPLTF